MPARKKLLEPLSHAPGEHPAMEHVPIDVNQPTEFSDTSMQEAMDRTVKQDPESGYSRRSKEFAGEGNHREEGFRGQSADEKNSSHAEANYPEGKSGGGEPFGLSGNIPPAPAYPGSVHDVAGRGGKVPLEYGQKASIDYGRKKASV